MSYKSILHTMLCTFMAFTLFACGGKNDPTDPSEENAGGNGSGTEVHSTEGCMYVGITGFNKGIYIKGGENSRYDVLNKNTLNDYLTFVNNQLNNTDKSANGTKLYYAVDDNLSYLKKCQFPSDVENVSIITFTDGLDQGSSALNNSYSSHTAYLNAIQEKIKSIKVNNVAITAYSIGIKGGDVTDTEQFNKNLEMISSGANYKTEVKDMTEVNNKFKSIANDLYKQNSKPQFSLQINKPFPNTKLKFTFDKIDRTGTSMDSKVYIEGIYKENGGTRVIDEIKYEGCSSESGSKLTAELVGEDIKFVLDNFVDANSKAIETTNLIKWDWPSDGNKWNPDIEFEKEKFAKITTIMKSAVVMLILDCSSSLDKKFADVQKSASDFLKILVNSQQNNPTPDPDPTPDPQDNNPHCWEYTYTYSGTTVTYYAWTTEAEMKAGIEELKKETGVSNVSYKRASANDENSCEALNPTPQPSTTDYYIKHPWGTGQDADWSWKSMTKFVDDSEGVGYYCEGKWGGVGVNINTKADDAGAKWFPSDKIYGADEVSIGQTCEFYYVIETGGYAYVAVSPKE